MHTQYKPQRAQHTMGAHVCVMAGFQPAFLQIFISYFLNLWNTFLNQMWTVKIDKNASSVVSSAKKADLLHKLVLISSLKHSLLLS